MQKHKKKLFSGLFMRILMLFWVSGTEAQLLALHQAVILLTWQRGIFLLCLSDQQGDSEGQCHAHRSI